MKFRKSVGVLPRERPTDPDRYLGEEDTVEEGSSWRRPSRSFNRSKRVRVGEIEFGIPTDGAEGIDIAPVDNPFKGGGAPVTRNQLRLGSLSEYDANAYRIFLDGGKKAVYKDGVVHCTKDSDNRPVCYLVAESTATKRRNGEVAAMQRAADKLLNQVPMFQNMDLSIPTSGGNIDGKAMFNQIIVKISGGGLPNPIGRRAGYDGWVGPSTFGLVILAVDIASNLKIEGVTPAVLAGENGFTEASLTYYAGDIARFLDDVAENFAKLLERYKANPPPNPMLVPEVLPVLRKKKWNGPIAAGLAAGLFAYAQWGQHKADKADRKARGEDPYSPGGPPMSGIDDVDDGVG